jgi:hypothetical protein
MKIQEKCRICSIKLDEINCYKSHLQHNIRICIVCDKEEKHQLYIKYRKIILMDILGGKCECCGIEKYEVLSIDHRFGGGNQEKKKLRGRAFLVKLVKNPQETKEKYRCLCYNCNYCIGFYGKCQHKINF